jgi:hypothetical protein
MSGEGIMMKLMPLGRENKSGAGWVTLGNGVLEMFLAEGSTQWWALVLTVLAVYCLVKSARLLSIRAPLFYPCWFNLQGAEHCSTVLIIKFPSAFIEPSE